MFLVEILKSTLKPGEKRVSERHLLSLMVTKRVAGKDEQEFVLYGHKLVKAHEHIIWKPETREIAEIYFDSYVKKLPLFDFSVTTENFWFMVTQLLISDTPLIFKDIPSDFSTNDFLSYAEIIAEHELESAKGGTAWMGYLQ